VGAGLIRHRLPGLVRQLEAAYAPTRKAVRSVAVTTATGRFAKRHMLYNLAEQRRLFRYLGVDVARRHLTWSAVEDWGERTTHSSTRNRRLT
jgi:hypothetical protein